MTVEDRAELEALFRALGEAVPQHDAPLVTLVIRASGAGLVWTHPLLLEAEDAPRRHYALLGLVHRALLDYAAQVQSARVDIERA